MAKRPKIIDAEFTVVGERPAPQHEPIVQLVLDVFRFLRPLAQVISIALLALGVSAIVTDGATTRAVHMWLFGW